MDFVIAAGIVDRSMACLRAASPRHATCAGHPRFLCTKDVMAGDEPGHDVRGEAIVTGCAAHSSGTRSPFG